MKGLQRVVDGYTLMFAALLLSAGALSDRIGARQSFGAGLAVFVAASTACGLVAELGVLVAARLTQGAGAAVMLPASLSVGLGASLTIAPMTALLVGSVPAERAGTASGVLNTCRQVGAALAVAVFGAPQPGSTVPSTAAKVTSGLAASTRRFSSAKTTTASMTRWTPRSDTPPRSSSRW